MKAVAVLLVLGVALPIQAHEIRLSHMGPAARVRLQSSGEPSAALIDLLVPFLALHHFQLDRPRARSAGGIDVAVFAANVDAAQDVRSDAVVATGTYNDLSLTYCTWATRLTPKDPLGPRHASQLWAYLKAFLTSLPAPRIDVTEYAIDTRQACSDAF